MRSSLSMRSLALVRGDRVWVAGTAGGPFVAAYDRAGTPLWIDDLPAGRFVTWLGQADDGGAWAGGFEGSADASGTEYGWAAKLQGE